MMVIVRNVNTVKTMKMTVMTTTMAMIAMTFMICKWHHMMQQGAI